MKLLAIDTSSKATVLGLKTGDDVIDRTTPAVNSHSREILPSIDTLLGDAGLALGDLDAIVFGQGPGSFTGLRIAVGVVQGLCFGLDIPAVPVSSMACLAQSVATDTPDNYVFVALTARLEEIYHGAYGFEHGLARPVMPEGVTDVSQLDPASSAGNWRGVGNAWELKDKIAGSLGVTFSSVHESATPTVQNLLKLGQAKYESGGAVDAMQAIPVYLREEVASRPRSSNGNSDGPSGGSR